MGDGKEEEEEEMRMMERVGGGVDVVSKRS